MYRSVWNEVTRFSHSYLDSKNACHFMENYSRYEEKKIKPTIIKYICYMHCIYVAIFYLTVFNPAKWTWLEY